MPDTSSSATRPVSPLWGSLGWLLAVVLIGLLYFAWQSSSLAFGRMLVPPPDAVFVKLGEMLGNADFWTAAGRTLATWLPGFVLGIVPGLAVGIVGGRFRAMASIFGPSLSVVAAFPVPFAAILLVVWAGTRSDIGGILAAALTALAIVSISLTLARNTDWKADFWRGLLRSLGLAAVLALAVVIFVEMTAGTAKLGTMLVHATSTFDVTRTFALGLALWCLGLLLAFPFLFVGWLVALIARFGAKSSGEAPLR